MRTASSSPVPRRVWRVASVAVALVMAVVAFGAPAYAQHMARVKIDFAFVAAGKDMPAGEYEISYADGRIVLQPQDRSVSTVMMSVITRLGRHDTDTDPELIFDKVGGKVCLSEFWLANDDGYLVLNTPTDHEHRVLGGSRPHK
ncbi:MAG TPA: hypothetical protein VGK32_00420 [Vicinamibacterales bacterium]|jgi:hypothetical protein